MLNGWDRAIQKTAIVVSCGCGLNYTLEQFRTLDLLGVQLVEDDRLELRLCVCGSTRGVWQ